MRPLSNIIVLALLSATFVVAMVAIGTTGADTPTRYVAVMEPWPTALLVPAIDAATLAWGQIWAPEPTTAVGNPVQILTASDTHYLVADAACTATTVSTDADCWSHTSGGAGGAGVPGSGNAAVSDASSGAGSFSLGGNMNVASWVMTGFTGTLNMGANTLTVNGNLTLAGTFNRNTSTVVFAASGSLSMTGNNINRALYNVTVNAGATLTNTTNNAWVANILTVNGTLLGGSPNDPQLVLFASGESAQDTDGDGEAEMLILGASGDVDTSGYLILRARGASGSTYEVPGGTYQHPAVQGGNATVSYTINQRGAITTPSCGVYNECAYLISSEATGTPAGNFVYNTNGFNITAGGTLWLGDGTTTGVTFNAGAATIDAYGINPTGDNVVVNWNTSTVTARPSSTLNPVCFYTSQDSRVNFNSSSFTCNGQFRIGQTAGASFANLGSATITVTDDAGCQNCQGTGYPGELNIVRSTNYLIMGTATVTVEDRWTNNSTSSSWDVGTSTVRLYWDFSNSAGTVTPYGHYFPGPTNLAEAEFYNLEVRAVGTGSRTVVSLDDSPPWGPVWVANRLTVADTDGGTLNLNMQNQNVTTNGTVEVAANATLTMGTGNLLGLSRLDVDGTLSMDSIAVANIDIAADQSYTFDITAWTAYDLAAATFDVRWTFGSISSATAELAVTLAELTHTVATDYTLARGGTSLRTATVPVDGTSLTIRWTGGWGSADAMAISSAAAAPPTGGGAEPTPFLPPWAVVMLLGAVFVIYVTFRGRKRK